MGGYGGQLQTPSSVFVLAPMGEKGVVGEALVLTSEVENVGFQLGGCLHHILSLPVPYPLQQQADKPDQQQLPQHKEHQEQQGSRRGPQQEPGEPANQAQVDARKRQEQLAAALHVHVVSCLAGLQFTARQQGGFASGSAANPA